MGPSENLLRVKLRKGGRYEDENRKNRSRNYSGGGTREGASHSLMGFMAPQSRHLVAEKREAQLGQTACVSKMSNGFRHLPQIQFGPASGAALHDGQAKPSRRGNFGHARQSNALPQSGPAIHQDEDGNDADPEGLPPSRPGR